MTLKETKIEVNMDRDNRQLRDSIVYFLQAHGYVWRDHCIDMKTGERKLVFKQCKVEAVESLACNQNPISRPMETPPVQPSV